MCFWYRLFTQDIAYKYTGKLEVVLISINFNRTNRGNDFTF